MRALIFGITGMDGSYLAELLLEKGYEVFGFSRRTNLDNVINLKNIKDKITILIGDIEYESSVYNAVRESNPDEIYNFAAQSYVPEAKNNPERTMSITGLGILRITESVARLGLHPKIFQANSCEIFTKENKTGICEESKIGPSNIYGIAKLAAYNICSHYLLTEDMFICNAFYFNHESPRRSSEFLTRKVTDAVARIHRGKQEKLILGNLDVFKDWGYAPDYVRAAWEMMQLNYPENFVIGTGQPRKIRDFVKTAFGSVGIKNWENYIEQDPRFMRKEIGYSYANTTKANLYFNWKPSKSFNGIVKEMVFADIVRIDNED